MQQNLDRKVKVVRAAAAVRTLPLFALPLLFAVSEPCPAQQSAACQAWQEHRDRLRPPDIERLDSTGLARSTLIVIGPALIADCEDRLRFADYIEDRVAGPPDDPSNRAYWRNRRDRLGRYVRKVWPLLSDHGGPLADGAFRSEAYAILVDDLVPTEDRLAAVSEEIRTQGVGGDLLYVLWQRKFDPADLIPLLRSQLKPLEAGEEDIVGFFYVAAALYDLGEPVHANVERYIKSRDIRPELAPFVDAVVMTMREGEPLELGDVLELEFH